MIQPLYYVVHADDVDQKPARACDFQPGITCRHVATLVLDRNETAPVLEKFQDYLDSTKPAFPCALVDKVGNLIFTDHRKF